MKKRLIPLIAVDISLLACESGGLTRYLRELLPELVRLSENRCEWVLYARNSTDITALSLSSVSLRQDKIPNEIGRVASLLLSLPYWAGLDMPDVFWGPAHRLPIWLPKSVKKVVTIHDLCWLAAPETMRPVTRRLDSLLMPRAIHQANQIITVSNSTRMDLIKHFPGATHKVNLVYEGASKLPAPLDSRILSTWCVNSPYILFVGTIEPRKNITRLLHAFAQVIVKVKSANGMVTMPQLVLVGASGWGRDKVHVEVESLKIGANVRIMGRVTDQQLSTLYKYAVCLVMPSIYEGFGLPLIEAMSQGIPVITSNTGAMSEIAGKAGLTVDPLSTESIASGIYQMFIFLSERNKLSMFAKDQAASFSWHKAANQTLDIFLNK